MIFGKTKGEFWVGKGKFRVDLFFFKGLESKLWTLFGNQSTHPPTFGNTLPKKTILFLGGSPKKVSPHTGRQGRIANNC